MDADDVCWDIQLFVVCGESVKEKKSWGMRAGRERNKEWAKVKKIYKEKNKQEKPTTESFRQIGYKKEIKDEWRKYEGGN